MDVDEVVKGSSLEVFVPQASDESVQAHFCSQDGGPIAPIEQRPLLYFDESVLAYIVLRTLHQEISQLQSFISRLVISLEVLAHGFPSRPSDSHNNSSDSSPAHNEDTLWSGVIETTKEPLCVAVMSEEKSYVNIIWKTTIPLSRPKMRLQNPTISFVPTAMLPADPKEKYELLKDPYLPSGIPTDTNLLESLKDNSVSRNAQPRLSAARLSRMSPVSKDVESKDRSIRTRPQNFSAVPALSSRVRYSRANTQLGKPSIMASLDIEIAPFSNDVVEITSVDMRLSEGSAEDIGKSIMPILPFKCQPRDNMVFLFRLMPRGDSSDGARVNPAQTLLITVHATVHISTSCQPAIEMRWKTGVDFSTALNPTFGPPAQSMQRHKRPSSLSRTSSSTNLSLTSIKETSSTSGGTQRRSRAKSISDFGVAVTFTASEKVILGEPFSWSVLVVNRSRKPRQLALTILPKNQKAASSVDSSISKPVDNYKDSQIMEPVLGENVLYSRVSNANANMNQVISLSNDVQTGTLNPNSCVSLELRMLPLTKGHLQVEMVRVTDVVSNESMDIRDLPDIWIEERENNE